MPDWLSAAARAAPDRLAVLADDARWTFGQLDAETSKFAGRIASEGAQAGDRVGVLLPASGAHVAVLHALVRVGAILVELDPRLPAAELEARAEATRIKFLVTDRTGPLPPGPQPIALSDLDAGCALRLPPREPRGSHALVFTSGTGGKPRAAMLTYENHAASAAQSAVNLGVRPDDRWLACVPLHHIGGLAAVLRSALGGTCIVLQDRFEPWRVNDAIDLDAVTLASFVPVMLRRVLDDRGAKPFPPTLRAVLLGGDAAPPALVEEARARGCPVLPTYGLTEAASQVACASPDDPGPAGSSGKPLSLTRVRIDAPPGEVGEIVVEGPIVFAGYDGDAEATARALGGGALHTGDVGRLDKDGRLWVVGRLDDRITTGGEKVDPAEVEAVLRAHPGVADACVVGLPDKEWGQRVVAAIVPKGAMPQDLDAHCRRALVPYKVPKQFVAVTSIPRSPAGKLLRGALRQTLS